MLHHKMWRTLGLADHDGSHFSIVKSQNPKNPSGHKSRYLSVFWRNKYSWIDFPSTLLSSTKDRNDFFLSKTFFFNIESLTPARDSHAYFLPSHLREIFLVYVVNNILWGSGRDGENEKASLFARHIEWALNPLQPLNAIFLDAL